MAIYEKNVSTTCLIIDCPSSWGCYSRGTIRLDIVNLKDVPVVDPKVVEDHTCDCCLYCELRAAPYHCPQHLEALLQNHKGLFNQDPSATEGVVVPGLCRGRRAKEGGKQEPPEGVPRVTQKEAIMLS